MDSLKSNKSCQKRKYENCIRRRFHQRRLRETKEALLSYTEAQIRNAHLSCDEMRQCVAKMRDFPLPQKSSDFMDGDEDDRKYN